MASYQTAENARFVLALTRDVIRAALEGDAPTLRFAEQLRTIPHHGMFVTLRNRDALRGCMGTFSNEAPFVETLVDTTRASLADPRFTDLPVARHELTDLRIEVSVLSPLIAITDAYDFEFGVEGVLIERDGQRGCFLPDVGQALGWDRETFLSTLCSQKAALAPDAWRDGTCDMFKFTVWKICE